jgi:hypothetical protein
VPDAPLFSLVDKVAAAKRARDRAVDRLPEFWDPNYPARAAEYDIAHDTFCALSLALLVSPSVTQAGVFAKASVLPLDNEDMIDRIEDLLQRFREGNWILDALRNGTGHDLSATLH